MTIILLLLCLALGIVLNYFSLVPANAYRVLNQLLIYIFIPALTFLHIAKIKFDSRFIIPVLSPWIIFFIAFLFFYFIGRWRNFSRKTIGTLILTGGIGSTSFIGFPIFEMLYGERGLAMGILMSQAGSFLVCITIGVITASWFAAEKPSIKLIVYKVIRFPPFIAFILAILFNISGYVHPPIVADILTKLSSPFTVLALLSVGMQINFNIQRENKEALYLGMIYKLLLAPIVIYVVCFLFIGNDAEQKTICVLGAALGPMNTAAAIADDMGLNGSLATQMVGIGIPVSIVVVSGIYIFLNF